MNVVLAAGLWLDGTAWDQVVPELEALGHRAVPVLLPGHGDGNDAATLADQVAAVVAAVDRAAPAVVVGHSAACTLAWMAADARVESVARVVMIGGFPAADGATYADFFDLVDAAMPFPGWEAFEGPDSADLDDELRARMAAAAVPVPAGVSHATVRLTDARRYAVPVTVVCPEFGPDDARAWVASGDVPELAAARHVDYDDIDSGHWPMFTAPRELARIIAASATG